MPLFRTLSLRQLLTVPYVVLVLLLALLVGLLSYRAGRTAVDSLSEQLLGETVGRIAQAVEKHVFGSGAVLDVAFPAGITAPPRLVDEVDALRTRFWQATSVHRELNNYAYYGDEQGHFFGLWRDTENEAQLRLRTHGEGPRTLYRFSGIHGPLTLPTLEEKAAANGYHHAEVVDPATVREMEPHLGDGITGGMLVPGEHLIDPWSTPIAFATEAVANGCCLFTGFEIANAVVGPEMTRLLAADGREIGARFVVNAAGLHGDTVHRLFGFDGFTIRPRRGELIVFDKLARPLLGRTILPVPTSHTKGVLVAPTVFGNIMLGPTADDIDDRGATGSTRSGLDGLLRKGHRILPALMHEEVTAVYAGLRAATEHSDYQLSCEPSARYICLGGIRSTGLTSSMALAEDALAMLATHMPATPKALDELATIRLTPLGEAGERPYQRGGTVVCHCERVTAEEIDAAIAAPVPARDVDGLRRRTRALAGRCQGFYCAAEVCAHAAVASDRPMSEWMGLP